MADASMILHLAIPCRDLDVPLFEEPSVRFAGRREAHSTFFLRDPSNNPIEFKHDDDAAMMY